MERYTAVETIVRCIGPRDLLLTTTGMITREVFVANDRPDNFYMIGSMGLLSSLGLGLALLKKDRNIVVIDGDGSALMSLGTIPLIAYESPRNFRYIILDNNSYESTGAQPCISEKIDLGSIVKASGFRHVESVEEPESLEMALKKTFSIDGPSCLHVSVDISRVDGVPRVSHEPEEIRDRFKQRVMS